MSNCDCNQGRQPCTCKPVPPAGDVPEYFVAACDKFDWTLEEALRFYAEGKHFDTVDGRTRILCTGAIASHALKGLAGLYADMKGIEPAGDVEAVCEVVDEKYNRVQFYRQTGDTSKPYHRPGEKLYDQACVTRLTAERDEIRAIKDSAIESVALLHAERYRLKMQLADSDHCYRQAHDTGVVVMRERDALQSKLTKARDLIATLEARVVMKDAGIDFRDALISEAQEIAYHELPCTWLSRASTLFPHQSAPAAKGGE